MFCTVGGTRINFPIWYWRNKWTRLLHVYNRYSNPQMLHTSNTFPEHIYFRYLSEISLKLFIILLSFRIKQNLHKSVWKLARLERSDVAKTDWWLFFFNSFIFSHVPLHMQYYMLCFTLHTISCGFHRLVVSYTFICFCFVRLLVSG